MDSTIKGEYIEYPNQELLEQGLTFGDSVETREKLTAHSKAVAENFDEMIEKYDIDVIIAPGDCMLSEYAAAGGQSILFVLASYFYFSLFNHDFIPFPHHLTQFMCLGFPIGTLPMSYLVFNGRPAGLLVAAQRHKDSTLIKVMSAWEATFNPRKEPTEFLKHTTVA